jgi:predicted metal-dependent phosphoesterase TrpH
MKIDLHLHTLYGSACAYMDPDQLILQAKQVGLDGVCITEHNQIWDSEAIERLQERHSFPVIGGVEVNTDLGEMLVFGLHQSVLSVYSALQLRTMVDEAEGVMIMAHPFRTEPELFSHLDLADPDPKKMISSGIGAVGDRPIFELIDALEIYNGRAGLKETAFTEAVAVHMNLPGTGGSDAHAILGVGACYTVFEEAIKDERDLIDQIKRGRFYGVDDRWRKDTREGA